MDECHKLKFEISFFGSDKTRFQLCWENEKDSVTEAEVFFVKLCQHCFWAVGPVYSLQLYKDNQMTIYLFSTMYWVK